MGCSGLGGGVLVGWAVRCSGVDSGVEGGAVGRWGRVVRWGEVARCGVGTLITRHDASDDKDSK